MNWFIPLAFLLGLALGLGISYGLIKTRDNKAAAANTQRRDLVGKDSNPLVCPPPMVGDETVMQWGLRTYAGKLGPRGANAEPEYGVWSLMVEDMYRLAAQDIGVARHFNFTDMEGLQRKFTATLTLVLDKGLRQKSIEAMKRVHAGYDITNREFDRVADILAGILQHYKVPAESYPAIIKIINAVKPVIVKEQRVEAS